VRTEPNGKPTDAIPPRPDTGSQAGAALEPFGSWYEPSLEVGKLPLFDSTQAVL